MLKSILVYSPRKLWPPLPFSYLTVKWANRLVSYQSTLHLAWAFVNNMLRVNERLNKNDLQGCDITLAYVHHVLICAQWIYIVCWYVNSVCIMCWYVHSMCIMCWCMHSNMHCMCVCVCVCVCVCARACVHSVGSICWDVHNMCTMCCCVRKTG